VGVCVEIRRLILIFLVVAAQIVVVNADATGFGLRTMRRRRWSG